MVSEDARMSALYDEASPLLPGDGRPEGPPPVKDARKETLKFVTAMVFVFSVGVVAWAIDGYLHRDVPRQKPDEVVEWRSQVLGWISAALFRECVQPVWKFSELTLAWSRSAGSADRCVAFISWRGTGTEGRDAQSRI